LVQAVVASGSTGDPATADRMDTALKAILITASSEDVELRIQAYNILRALFRSNSLGEVGIAVFAGDGLALALKGFMSSNWAVSLNHESLFLHIMYVYQRRSFLVV